MGLPKNLSDRRRSVRVTEKLPFVIGHQGYEIQATSVNISNNGVRCMVNRDIPVMTQLDIAFSLPVVVKFSSKEELIKAKGVVVRKEKDIVGEKYCIAVYFSEVKPKDQEILNEFIKTRLKT